MSIELRSPHAALLLLVAAGAMASCIDERDREPRAGNECTACHGETGRDSSALLSAAPPSDLSGSSDRASRGVGAHRLHLRADASHAAVACDECHVVPDETFSEGHLDSTAPAEVVFGVLARQDGRDPLWDPENLSCSGSYCHGEAEPVWNEPSSSEEACGSCHGTPPPAPHPQSDACADCHGDVLGADGEFVAPERHVNGVVDVTVTVCNGCHGHDESGAPPPDLDGSHEASSRGVGAHERHLVEASNHGPVACNECHVVPESVDDEGHLDSERPAEVVFGELATEHGASPEYDSKDLSCSGSYCHGNADPVWTEPRTPEEACGSCHALPPPAPHPQSGDCSECHGDVIDSDGEFVDGTLHVNGTVELGALPCNGCHGSDVSGAPPPDLSGSSDPSRPGVGAHALHLEASASHGPVACDECHVVPRSFTDEGHLGSELPAELRFGELASLAGASPEYDASLHRCAGTYCHGAAEPIWTEARTTSEACGTCHALPPPAPHPAGDDCSSCHSEVIDAAGEFVDGGLHVNGSVDLGPSIPCNACHGAGPLGAPPPDLTGSTSDRRPGVGAHSAHLGPGSGHAPIPCDSCHVVPESYDAAGHADSDRPAEVRFGEIAVQGGASPEYDSASGSCSGTYCHGDAEPVWTEASTGACGTCHGFPPAAPHPSRSDCVACHSAVIDATYAFVEPERHVDGTVDVDDLGCDACHGASSSGAPPPDLAGNSDVASPGVGAHELHLSDSATHAAVACAECHSVPSSYTTAGHIDATAGAEVVFGALATGDGASTPSYDSATGTCSNVYCHMAAEPLWTEPTGEPCGSCHALPPPAPHLQVDDCSLCHSSIDSNRVFTDPSLHGNGAID